eukprot:5876107-Pyramimonas_sp.AAC.1
MLERVVHVPRGETFRAQELNDETAAWTIALNLPLLVSEAALSQPGGDALADGSHRHRLLCGGHEDGVIRLASEGDVA